MVDFKRLSSRARDLVEKRGGTESLKQDAAQLKEIAKGKGKMSDKAKAAMSAIKEPGARTAGADEAAKPAPTAAPAAKARPEEAEQPAPPADPAAPARADEKVGDEERGKHAHADKQ